MNYKTALKKHWDILLRGLEVLGLCTYATLVIAWMVWGILYVIPNFIMQFIFVIIVAYIMGLIFK